MGVQVFSKSFQGFQNRGSRGMSSGNRFTIAKAISHFVFAPESEKARLTRAQENRRVTIDRENSCSWVN